MLLDHLQRIMLRRSLPVDGCETRIHQSASEGIMRVFNDVIQNRDQLRAVLEEPRELVTRKTLSYLDKHCGAFIGRSPFVLLASADSNGNTDVSPKGDPIGFVKILDKNTLAIPDRPGNHRADSEQRTALCRTVVSPPGNTAPLGSHRHHGGTRRWCNHGT